MTRIAGIAGSLRQSSYNRALLRAATQLTPDGVTIETCSIDAIPLYNNDVENIEFPAAVTQLKEQIKASDGILLVTPEYNAGVPGVMKNAIDWCSRPPADIKAVFGGRPVALMGATPGTGGTKSAQIAWLATLRHLGTRPWFGAQLYVPKAGEVFDEAGELKAEDIRTRLRKFLRGYADFIRDV